MRSEALLSTKEQKITMLDKDDTEEEGDVIEWRPLRSDIYNSNLTLVPRVPIFQFTIKQGNTIVLSSWTFIVLIIFCILMLFLIALGATMIFLSNFLWEKEYHRHYEPSESGYGYKNPKAISMTSETQCTVIVPKTDCHEVLQLGIKLTVCRAKVSYHPKEYGELKRFTNTTFDVRSSYANYLTGRMVSCYYDPYRKDLVSYYSYMNIPNSKSYLPMKIFGILFVTTGIISILIACCILEGTTTIRSGRI